MFSNLIVAWTLFAMVVIIDIATLVGIAYLAYETLIKPFLSHDIAECVDAQCAECAAIDPYLTEAA